MKIDRETLLLAGDELETEYSGVKDAIKALPDEPPAPQKRAALLSILVGAASAAAIANCLYRLMSVSNQFIDSLDVENKTDEQVLEELKQRLIKDYFEKAAKNGGKVLVIITALINAAKKKAGL